MQAHMKLKAVLNKISVLVDSLKEGETLASFV